VIEQATSSMLVPTLASNAFVVFMRKASEPRIGGAVLIL
jgi:hypothetical protein